MHHEFRNLRQAEPSPVLAQEHRPCHNKATNMTPLKLVICVLAALGTFHLQLLRALGVSMPDCARGYMSICLLGASGFVGIVCFSTHGNISAKEKPADVSATTNNQVGLPRSETNGMLVLPAGYCGLEFCADMCSVSSKLPGGKTGSRMRALDHEFLKPCRLKIATSAENHQPKTAIFSKPPKARKQIPNIRVRV